MPRTHRTAGGWGLGRKGRNGTYLRLFLLLGISVGVQDNEAHRGEITEDLFSPWGNNVNDFSQRRIVMWPKQ